MQQFFLVACDRLNCAHAQDEHAAAIWADDAAFFMINMQIHFGVSERPAAAIASDFIRLHVDNVGRLHGTSGTENRNNFKHLVAATPAARRETEIMR